MACAAKERGAAHGGSPVDTFQGTREGAEGKGILDQRLPWGLAVVG
jgi:hypothetical protein